MDLLQNAGGTISAISEFDKTLQSSMGTIRNRRRTVAQSEIMTVKFDFFSELVSFSFFFFCDPLPLFFFISIFWRGARGAQNEAKDAANGRNGKSQNLQKSSILGTFFFARGNGEKRWKSSTLLFCAAPGAKKVKIMGVAQ